MNIYLTLLDLSLELWDDQTGSGKYNVPKRYFQEIGNFKWYTHVGDLADNKNTKGCFVSENNQVVLMLGEQEKGSIIVKK